MTHLTFHKVLVTGVQFDQNDSSVVDDPTEALRTATRSRRRGDRRAGTEQRAARHPRPVVARGRAGRVRRRVRPHLADRRERRRRRERHPHRRPSVRPTTPPRWRGDEPSVDHRGVEPPALSVVVAAGCDDGGGARRGSDPRRAGHRRRSGPDDRLHVQAWRHGDDLLDAGQIVRGARRRGRQRGVRRRRRPARPSPSAWPAIVDRDHPEMSVVLVASPDERRVARRAAGGCPRRHRAGPGRPRARPTPSGGRSSGRPGPASSGRRP